MPPISQMTISQLEFVIEGYRHVFQSTINGGLITIALTKEDESEHVSINVSRTMSGTEPFSDTYRNALAEAVTAMIAYEHRKDDE
jgi:DNA-binding protein YbaB